MNYIFLQFFYFFQGKNIHELLKPLVSINFLELISDEIDIFIIVDI